VEYGYGTIPPNAFQTQGRVARLAVTVAPGPEFTISRCTEDWYHGVYDCSDSVGGGSISLTWIPSNGYSTFRRGVEEFGVGFVTYRVNGTIRSSTARADGHFLGSVVEGANGEIRRGSTVQHEILRMK
jgi:hypothetical protein